MKLFNDLWSALRRLVDNANALADTFGQANDAAKSAFLGREPIAIEAEPRATMIEEDAEVVTARRKARAK